MSDQKDKDPTQQPSNRDLESACEAGKRVIESTDEPVDAKPGVIQQAKDKAGEVYEAAKETGQGLIDRARQAGQAVVETAQDAGQAVADKAAGAKDYIAQRAKNAACALKEAKDTVVEKVGKPGEVIDDVKCYGTEKAKQAEGLLEKLERTLTRASEVLDQIRDWSTQKADQLNRTLDSAQTFVMQAEETLTEAHTWGRDKAARLGDVMDKTKEAIERSAERLAAQTEELRRQGKQAYESLKEASREVRSQISAQGGSGELRLRIDQARSSIRELEGRIRQLGVDPSGVRLYGTANPDAQVLRDRILEEERHVTEWEEELRLGRAEQHRGPQIVPEKR